MSGFDRLGRELEHAAEHGRAAAWSRRAGSAGAMAAIAASIATVAVVAVGAVVLLGAHRTRPASTAGTTYSQAAPGAQVAAWARLLSCPPAGEGKNPVMSDAAPDRRLVAALGVLQGPWTAVDAAPAGTCRSVASVSDAHTLDIRYVRYVGPGLRGGQVFLVPETVALPREPSTHAYAKSRASLSELACLLTIGGPSPSSTACTPLAFIDRPLSLAIGLPTLPARITLAVARHECAVAFKRAAARVRCVHQARNFHYPAPKPQIVTGVVRDGVVSVDVYAGIGHAKRLVLTGVPVEHNVYAFQTTPALTGPLTLVFRDAGGQALPITPIRTGTGTITAVTTPLPAPPRSSASPRTGAPRRR
ncbi:MAG TPA: hypothetical protein VIJ20_13135 [Solirubrobacteraceae bacterium]